MAAGLHIVSAPFHPAANGRLAGDERQHQEAMSQFDGRTCLIDY